MLNSKEQLWQPYATVFENHTTVGDMWYYPRLWNPYNRNHRHILVYLPPSYQHSQRHYPVIYMHDGQNLFDAHTSFSGEWHVDESMEALSKEGIEAIIVGIPNMGDQRIWEYSPFPDPRHKSGGGGKYIRFIANRVKPLIDQQFRTQPDPAHTGIMGSSMGGLISLYAFLQRPDLFGLIGAMSPSLWFAQQAIFKAVQQSSYYRGKFYLDSGTEEYIDFEQKGEKIRHTIIQSMYDLLNEKGYTPPQYLRYVEEVGAAHTESAWARRFPDAIRFLLQE